MGCLFLKLFRCKLLLLQFNILCTQDVATVQWLWGKDLVSRKAQTTCRPYVI